MRFDNSDTGFLGRWFCSGCRAGTVRVASRRGILGIQEQAPPARSDSAPRIAPTNHTECGRVLAGTGSRFLRQRFQVHDPRIAPVAPATIRVAKRQLEFLVKKLFAEPPNSWPSRLSIQRRGAI